jgi:hypothetical protein
MLTGAGKNVESDLKDLSNPLFSMCVYFTKKIAAPLCSRYTFCDTCCILNFMGWGGRTQKCIYMNRCFDFA